MPVVSSQNKLPFHRALVLGATGCVGGARVRELREGGFHVRALRRWCTAARESSGPVEWMVGDLDDEGSLQRAMAGCDVVFVAVPPWAPGMGLEQSARRARRLIKVASDAELKRVVWVSSAHMVHSLTESQGALGEEHRYVPGTMSGLAWSASYVWEQEALQAAGQGLPVVVVQPSLCLGPGDVRSAGWLQGLRRKRLKQKVFSSVSKKGQRRVSVVDVRDVASATVRAVWRGRDGERYLLPGHAVSLEMLASQIIENPAVQPSSLAAHAEVLVEHGRLWSSLKATEVLAYQARPLGETLRAV